MLTSNEWRIETGVLVAVNEHLFQLTEWFEVFSAFHFLLLVTLLLSDAMLPIISYSS
ncbi:hypothetical protein RS130_21985 [Paraglaciecola aquimarina]|uniref:Uncharacterized protein n=1 Tax=Paraglaciecola aquimarina TaxID=1235557 RepID=A0ABU3T1P8_9ALTE|nr:hypothetical protein [Paraglaciecola aquimarina]MDU0356193.1 hypothetical protein [Paraglaciecola aquimarina]